MSIFAQEEFINGSLEITFIHLEIDNRKKILKRALMLAFIQLQQLNPSWEEFIEHEKRITVSLRTFRRFKALRTNGF